MTNYIQHPIGKRIPAMTGEQFLALKANIKDNGFLKDEPIVLFEGKVLDGWHRYSACKELNIEPVYVQFLDFDIHDSPLSYVWSKNKVRRHFSATQLAAIAVDLLPDLEKESKLRIIVGAKNKAMVNLPQPNIGTSREKAAKLVGVNARYIQDMKKIHKETPEQFEKMLRGDLSLESVKTENKQKKLEAKKIEIAKTSTNSVSLNPPQVKHTDCISFLNSYKDNEIDCLITDPPYSTDINDINKFVDSWLPLALSKVKENGRCYICTGAYPIELQAYLNVLLKQTKFIVDNPLIWTYRNTLGITPKNKYNLNYQLIWHLYSNKSPQLDTSITNEMFSVQDINAPDGRLGNRFHTWQKPDELSDRFIRHGTQKDDLVVDPFCCTGTFLISASKAGRKSIGCDINKDNLDIAVKRGCKLI